ncbi:MAG: hypothetical protein RIR41_1383 [Pseudomonadota bacterium]
MRGRILKRILIVATAALALCACEDLDAAVVALSDDLSIADGYYYDDVHDSSPIDGDCNAEWDYGRVNNQTYARVTNNGYSDASFRVTWTAGPPSEFYLAPGDTSEFVYRSGSNIPKRVEVTC